MQHGDDEARHEAALRLRRVRLHKRSRAAQQRRIVNARVRVCRRSETIGRVTVQRVHGVLHSGRGDESAHAAVTRSVSARPNARTPAHVCARSRERRGAYRGGGHVVHGRVLDGVHHLGVNVPHGGQRGHVSLVRHNQVAKEGERLLQELQRGALLVEQHVQQRHEQVVEREQDVQLVRLKQFVHHRLHRLQQAARSKRGLVLQAAVLL